MKVLLIGILFVFEWAPTKADLTPAKYFKEGMNFYFA